MASTTTKAPSAPKPPPTAAKIINRVIVRVNIALFRASGGKVGGKMGALSILLLTTRGRKTGKRRTMALGYVRDGDRYIVSGAYGGAPVDPAWCHNLRAIPDATIEVGKERIEVTATEAPHGDERDRLWRSLVQKAPQYEKFQSKTDRVLPIMILAPKDTAPAGTRP